MLGAETGISHLPNSLSFLSYVLWVVMFVGPKLGLQWYCRRHERAANECMSSLVSPRAAISALTRLFAADGLVSSRPWWARVISTHPTADHAIAMIARDASVSPDEVERIRDKARLGSEPGDTYELAFHGTYIAKRVDRPSGHGTRSPFPWPCRWEPWLWVHSLP